MLKTDKRDNPKERIKRIKHDLHIYLIKLERAVNQVEDFYDKSVKDLDDKEKRKIYNCKTHFIKIGKRVRKMRRKVY